MASPTLPKRVLCRLEKIPKVAAAFPYLRVGKPARQFQALRKEVFDLSGHDFLAHVELARPLGYVSPLESVADRSRHVCADAFDVNKADPKMYAESEIIDGQQYWRLLVESSKRGQHQHVVDRLGETSTRRVVDFTALAEQYGFRRVPALQGWRDDGARRLWWHYQLTDNLTWDECIEFIYGQHDLARPMRLALNDRVFGLNDRSIEVRNLQTMLLEVGMLRADGIHGVFDIQTRDAVIAFQTANNLKPTGIADARSRRVLINQVLATVGQKKEEKPSP